MAVAPTQEAVGVEPTGLTEFLEAYEREYPAEVVRVARPVNRRHELTAILTRLEREQRFPVVVFERVTDDIGLALESRQRGMRAVLLKACWQSTRRFEEVTRRPTPHRWRGRV